MLTAREYLEMGGGSVAEDLAPVRALMLEGIPEAEAVARVAARYEGEARAAGIGLDTQRGTVADVLRRYLAGPGVCAACGSLVAMGHLCALCEADPNGRG